ncbi:MAG: hypothetical protein ACOYOQ_10415 [Microthrixaceae bacterium]
MTGTTRRPMALARSDIALSLGRAKAVALLMATATIVATVGLSLRGGDGTDAPTLARLAGPDSLSTRVLPLVAFAALFVPAAGAAARRRSFDGLVVVQPGPLRGPLTAAVAVGTQWAAVVVAFLVGASVAITVSWWLRGSDGPLGRPGIHDLAAVGSGLALVVAIAAWSWLVGWSCRRGQLSAALLAGGIAVVGGSVVAVVTGGAPVTRGWDGLVGGTLDLSVRGGPLGMQLSGVEPMWFTVPGIVATSATAALLLTTAAVLVVADRSVPTPYSPG